MNQTSTFIDDSDEKVELFLSCRKLKSGIDAQVKISIERAGSFAFFDQTETIKDNLNPNFTKTALLDYVFEVKQKIRFEINNNQGSNKDEIYGTVETTLGEIVGSKNMVAIYDIYHKGKPHGKLIIRVEKVRENHSTVEMTLSGHNLMNTAGFFGKSNPLVKLSRMAGDSGFVAVFESEVVKKDLNPVWNNFEIKVRKLCNGDYQRPIKAEVFSRSGSKDTLIGECQFTIDELSQQERRDFTLYNSHKNKKTGTLRVTNFKLQERPGFLDYLRGGSQLAVMVAVDFTSSNGDPHNPESLHAFKYDGTLNEYQKAIMGVCDILLHYDTDKKVPMLGFGGRPKFPKFTTPSVSHSFFLSENQANPWAYGLDGIMQAYLNALHNVELSGPTLFAPIMQEAMKAAVRNKNEGSVEYTILLILTDGEIHDMEQTINCLIRSAHLPLSVIIVGVGKADFTNMIILDGDDGLANSDGVKAERDLVQFVPFRDFSGNQELLAKHVLEEIPAQVVEYYTSMKILPRPSENIDVARLLRGNTIEDRGPGNAPENGKGAAPGSFGNGFSRGNTLNNANNNNYYYYPENAQVRQGNNPSYSNVNFAPSSGGNQQGEPEKKNKPRKESFSDIEPDDQGDKINIPFASGDFEVLNKFSIIR